MFTARNRRHRVGGFTLLEITLAVAILAMMSMAIYRFVATNLTALRISAEANVVDATYGGFLNMLSTQWQSLPPGVSAMSGESLRLNDRWSDQVTWVCGAGPGLLTRYAAGDYRVSLRIRPAKKGDAKLEIGIARKPFSDAADDISNESWVPLLSNVQDLHVEYYDPQVSTWVPQWQQQQLPHLVRVIIGRLDSAVPWEVVIPIERTSLSSASR
ncbi:MAG: prepilin-type N-terminal cleavage/methylation domain-containing protein [Chthoniobacterales bacterium]